MSFDVCPQCGFKGDITNRPLTNAMNEYINDATGEHVILNDSDNKVALKGPDGIRNFTRAFPDPKQKPVGGAKVEVKAPQIPVADLAAKQYPNEQVKVSNVNITPAS